MLKYTICCDVCGTEQTTDIILQSKFGQHLCFCPVCASYLKAAQYRNQLPFVFDDAFKAVNRDDYIKEQIINASKT